MTSAIQLEILDLRHFSANTLRPVLEEETALWGERLDWDYRASARLLLQYLDSHVLPGFVAVENGRVTGYVFCVYEANKAVIGDVFAMSLESGSATKVEIRLLEHIIELLQSSPGVCRIESQLLLHEHGLHRQIFEQNGFTVFPRLFMEQDLHSRSVTQLPKGFTLHGGLPDDLEIRSWTDADFASAGRLIVEAYEGHLDSRINDQYCTVAGALRFLHNIVRFPGCGIFDPTASRVIASRTRNELVALLLCSRVRSDVGHVTQVCVAKEYRNRGLASFLLASCAADLRGRGFQALTLTVTEANANAVALYRQRGYVSKHRFSAMVWLNGQ
ncbi:MAG TPA: GNAT family N-acetyltransferase [Acidisarcina sp.]|nr:GNAT family N-acetyltransferase [Acidisarcina sp.]